MDGSKFVSKAPSSVWENEPAIDGGLQKRLLSCPPGYELKGDAPFTDQDECVVCPQRSYLLKPVRWEGPDVLLPGCFSCPTSVICQERDVIEARMSCWRPSTVRGWL